MEWLDAIRSIRALKLALARRDPRRGLPVAPPGGASEEAIASAERRMGMRLPPSYRALLAMHDGWPQIFGATGLLGVLPLTRGAYLGVAQMMIEENEGAARPESAQGAGGVASPREMAVEGGRGQGEGDGARSRGRMRAAGLVPFGIDAEAETLFAWDPESVRADGEMEVVVWMSGLGMRLGSFPELLELLVDMLAAELEVNVDEGDAAALSVTPVPPSSHVRQVGGAASGLARSPSRVGQGAPPPLSLRPAPRPAARTAFLG
ncbi:SMI1/KNR4 family protein [Chondromyces apiculatus]|uniref:Knr4/Smi1-like domain-containing protein n=1 Tax=Chondromyces apiculatus DSM 436 TaxID=1192034 RepID=A0A017TDL0_9BACT|nr:SMI1/KNR4 family protein [Chondromyces apiculatus]EYF07334.1 Hypothetical protein CAP_0087 [Chondromyces apiculatus DSM 436]